MENKMSEEMSEVLETVWTLQEQDAATVEKVLSNAAITVSQELLETLGRDGLLSIDDAKGVRLLPKGRQIAELIIRRVKRHRKLDLQAFAGKLPDARDHAAGADRNLPGADA